MERRLFSGIRRAIRPAVLGRHYARSVAGIERGSVVVHAENVSRRARALAARWHRGDAGPAGATPAGHELSRSGRASSG